MIPEYQNANNIIEWTGERYVPWADDPMTTYEHLHRYRLVKTIVRGKKVLDLGCGEGYGTFMLSEDAAHVTGIDIDDTAIRHASAKYIRDNISFVRGSMSDVPLEGHNLFNVIVCFEALEHIKAHDKLLSEVKRLLQKDGIFIVSTPNKTIYTEGTGHQNPFHVKELYFNEFSALLSDNFKNVFFYGQKIYPSSNIFPLNGDSVSSRTFVVKKGREAFHFVPSQKRVAKYYIAIASDTEIDSNEIAFDSHLIDLSEALIRQKDSCADDLRHQIEKLKAVIHEKNMSISDLEEAARENDLRIQQSAGLAKKVMDALPSLENLLKGLEMESLAPAVSVEAGELCFNLGLMDTAGNFFKKAIATDPENSDALNNLGVLEIHKGNVESARNYFMRALSVSPGNREAKINLDMLPHSPDMAGVVHSCSADAAGKGTV